MSLVASLSDKLPTVHSVYDEMASCLGSRLEDNFPVWNPHVSLIQIIDATAADKATINSFVGLEKSGFCYSTKVHFRKIEFRLTTKGEKEMVNEDQKFSYDGWETLG